MARMTQREIRAMFVQGHIWDAENSYLSYGDGRRIVDEIKDSQICWKMPNGEDFFTDLPRLKDIIQARDGFLQFSIMSGKHTVSLTRVSQG